MCGIWGFVSNKPRKFDYTSFCTLGIANDARGGDSCGIFIDGHFEYGVDKKKYFLDFFPENEFLAKLNRYQVAFGHCRKASVGVIDAKTAQPVVLEKNGKVVFVVMHNGTIHNYKELAEKYIPDVNITGMTDSQVMAHIFYYEGYNVLSEYCGGSVFAIADYRKEEPEILLFKGASKKNSWAKDETEERPLYFCENKGELIFSSICRYLYALRPKCDIWDINPNIICKYTPKGLVEVKKVDRSNCTQDAPITTYYTPGKTYTRTYPYYNDEDYWFDDYTSTNQMTNTYWVHGSKLHGKQYMNITGCISEKPKPSYREVYFWNGIFLRGKAYYTYLLVLQKKLNMDDIRFTEEYQNLIRFFSIDRVYCKDGIWYEAISPTKHQVFSGELCMLTSYTVNHIENGQRGKTTYLSKREDIFCCLDKLKKIDFNDIKEECVSLMKLGNVGLMNSMQLE